MPYNIWAILFLEAQGYKVIRNVLFQDNQSAILMQKNGRNSCTGNSRHINVRYFWIKDRVDNGDVLVKHCPTEMMLADFLRKHYKESCITYIVMLLWGMNQFLFY